MGRYSTAAHLSFVALLLVGSAWGQLVTFRGTDLKRDAPAALNANFSWLNVNKVGISDPRLTGGGGTVIGPVAVPAGTTGTTTLDYAGTITHGSLALTSCTEDISKHRSAVYSTVTQNVGSMVLTWASATPLDMHCAAILFGTFTPTSGGGALSLSLATLTNGQLATLTDGQLSSLMN